MPIVEIHLLEGYDADAKRRLGEGLTDAVRFVVPAGPEAITVMVHEMKADEYYRGGKMRMPAPPLPDPADLVRTYLNLMEARRITDAEAMLGEGFQMIFPGAPPMTRLQELIDWAAPRYRFVKKTYHGFDAMQGAEAAVVYARGTLSGEWLDGEAFADIRFIDRFEVAGGRIIRQDVWNDIAEVKTQEGRS